MDVGLVVAVATLLVAALAAWLAWPSFRSAGQEKRVARFRSERISLQANRIELVSSATDSYSPDLLIPGTRCLSPMEWRLEAPVPIENVRVVFDSAHRKYSLNEALARAQFSLPHEKSDGRRARYSSALMADERIRPKLFWDSPSFDVREYSVNKDHIEIRCGISTYFEMFDICESLAHEYSSSRRRRPKDLKLRGLVGDPFDLDKRPFVPAIPTLILLHESMGTTSFVMHARDSSAVASAGGFKHFIGGQFQPSSRHAIEFAEEADLWLSVTREIAEELLGADDASGHSGGRISSMDSPYREMQELRSSGLLTLWVLGMGVDALSLWPDLLTVAVAEKSSFESAFPNVVTANSEGTIVGSQSQGGTIRGYDFSFDTVDRLCNDHTVAPAATACLRLAWLHRNVLLQSAPR
jgi:hypothetical protein